MKFVSKNKLKYLLLSVFVCLCFSSNAQEKVIIKYYDSVWIPTSIDSAYYFTEFTKKNDIYYTKSYWIKSKKLNCTSSYFDTLFARPAGQLVRYYETGKTLDSIIYENGKIKNAYRYYSNGNL